MSTWNNGRIPDGCYDCEHLCRAWDYEADWAVLYCELDKVKYFEGMDADGHCSQGGTDGA